MRYFLVELPLDRSFEGLDAMLTTIDEHFAWIRRQHDSGRLLVSPSPGSPPAGRFRL